jgi:hypothetical protein
MEKRFCKGLNRKSNPSSRFCNVVGADMVTETVFNGRGELVAMHVRIRGKTNSRSQDSVMHPQELRV